jgi:RNA polymerase sigma-70 factor (ECF subfamily)
LTIKELYQRLKSGDPAARDQLYQQLYVSFRILARHRIRDWNDAEETVQAAMLKVTSKIDQVADPERFPAWAHKILKNEIIDYYRSVQVRQRREVEQEAGELSGASESPNPDLKMRLKECLKKVNAVFPRHARILNLKYQGYSTPEISERLGVTPNNLHVMLSRVRVLLKKCLETGEVKS